jgi:hypothetical protein
MGGRRWVSWPRRSSRVCPTMRCPCCVAPKHDPCVSPKHDPCVSNASPRATRLRSAGLCAARHRSSTRRGLRWRPPTTGLAARCACSSATREGRPSGFSAGLRRTERAWGCRCVAVSPAAASVFGPRHTPSAPPLPHIRQLTAAMARASSSFLLVASALLLAAAARAGRTQQVRGPALPTSAHDSPQQPPNACLHAYERLSATGKGISATLATWLWAFAVPLHAAAVLDGAPRLVPQQGLS